MLLWVLQLMFVFFKTKSQKQKPKKEMNAKEPVFIIYIFTHRWKYYLDCYAPICSINLPNTVPSTMSISLIKILEYAKQTSRTNDKDKE